MSQQQLSNAEVLALQDAATKVFHNLRRAGRIPARLDEEEHADAIQEGILASLSLMSHFDPSRGSLSRFLARPMERAMLRAAWKSANLGITGDHGGVQVWSLNNENDEGTTAEMEEEGTDSPIEFDLPHDSTPIGLGDPAIELEAFEQVWLRLHKK